MAKLKGPLFSLGASGKLADTLVYFSWKGLNIAREYVIPSNPDTAPQQTQRAYMTAAVAAIHAAQARAANPLDSADQVANSALAAAKGKIMTWFNQICKLWIDVKVNSKIPVVYSDGRTDGTSATAITVELALEEEGGGVMAAGKFYFGTSKTNLINSHAAVVAADTTAYISAADLSAFITAGKKYFWQFRPDSGDGCEGADSGIYNFLAT